MAPDPSSPTDQQNSPVEEKTEPVEDYRKTLPWTPKPDWPGNSDKEKDLAYLGPGFPQDDESRTWSLWTRKTTRYT